MVSPSLLFIQYCYVIDMECIVKTAWCVINEQMQHYAPSVSVVCQRISMQNYNWDISLDSVKRIINAETENGQFTDSFWHVETIEYNQRWDALGSALGDLAAFTYTEVDAERACNVWW